jgi:hypothetical protein
MQRRIAVLNPTIVARAQEVAACIKNGGPNRNAAFREPFASLFQRDPQHCIVIEILIAIRHILIIGAAD